MQEDTLLTIEQVAVHLQVHPQTVYRWITAGRLGSVRVGTRTVRVREADLREFVRPVNGRPAKT